VPLELDTATIERARSNPDDLDRLLALVWPEAYRISFGILHDRGLAEDSAQETCVAIAGSLQTLASIAAFRFWCYKIIVNRAITAARRRERQQESSYDLLHQPPALGDVDVIDLRRALARLSHMQRGAIILHYYVGPSSREIADATRH
jgi:RNA polymerase sigma factor (sigma-70 family)